MTLGAKSSVEEVKALITLGQAKGNPAFLLPLIKVLLPPIVKMTLLYFGLKTGYRIADKVSDAIAIKVGQALGLPPTSPIVAEAVTAAEAVKNKKKGG